jgi:2-methylisocitrate lyase-like PEP mutase family enzyme
MNQNFPSEDLASAGEFIASQKEKARKLRKRLHSGEAFIAPEAWDFASARILADAGHDVIGVSATSIAWSNGYQAFERLPLAELLDVTGRIMRGFTPPLIADLEGAVDRSPDELAEAAAKVLSFGCAGISFSDGGRNGVHGVAPVEHMAQCVKAVKAAAVEAKVPAVIAARTEAFLLGPRGHSPFETSVERSEAYFAAGADCVIVPGLQQIQIIERLAGVVDGPLGISIGLTPAPDFKSLAKAGVACVTLGSTFMRSLLGMMRLRAEELLAFGHFNNLERAIPEDQLMTLLR